eukprot:2589420-Prorocentrum_lima.AAC.1
MPPPPAVLATCSPYMACWAAGSMAAVSGGSRPLLSWQWQFMLGTLQPLQLEMQSRSSRGF